MYAKLSEICLGLNTEVRWPHERIRSMKFLFEGCWSVVET